MSKHRNPIWITSSRSANGGCVEIAMMGPTWPCEDLAGVLSCDLRRAEGASRRVPPACPLLRSLADNHGDPSRARSILTSKASRSSRRNHSYIDNS
jgi:hypothetical protein